MLTVKNRLVRLNIEDVLSQDITFEEFCKTTQLSPNNYNVVDILDKAAGTYVIEPVLTRLFTLYKMALYLQSVDKTRWSEYKKRYAMTNASRILKSIEPYKSYTLSSLMAPSTVLKLEGDNIVATCGVHASIFKFLGVPAEVMGSSVSIMAFNRKYDLPTPDLYMVETRGKTSYAISSTVEMILQDSDALQWLASFITHAVRFAGAASVRDTYSGLLKVIDSIAPMSRDSLSSSIAPYSLGQFLKIYQSSISASKAEKIDKIVTNGYIDNYGVQLDPVNALLTIYAFKKNPSTPDASIPQDIINEYSELTVDDMSLVVELIAVIAGLASGAARIVEGVVSVDGVKLGEKLDWRAYYGRY